jgi:branched-chain amino acid transport system permease protein
MPMASSAHFWGDFAFRALEYIAFGAGYVLTFGATRTLNFAHAVSFAAGGIIAAVLLTHGYPMWLASIDAIVAAGFLGVVIDRIALWPLRAEARENGRLLASAAVAALAFGALPFLQLPSRYPATAVHALARVFGSGAFADRLPAMAALLLALLVVWALLRSTRWGIGLRSVASDSPASRAAGVNVDVVVMQTAFIAAALGSLAGIADDFYRGTGAVGPELQLSVFAVIALGGMGSLQGIAVAALAVTLAEAIASLAMPGAAPIADIAIVLGSLPLLPRGLISRRALRQP